MGNACTLAMEPAPLSGDWTQAVSCVSFIPLKKHVLEAAAYCMSCELLWLTTYRQRWNTTFNFDVRAVKSDWTTETSCPLKINNEDYLQEIFVVNSPILHRKRKALWTQSWRKHIEGYAPYTRQVPAPQKHSWITQKGTEDAGQNKYQMILRNCKGNKKEQMAQWHVVSTFVIFWGFFLSCLNYYRFEFLYKIKVAEAEFSADHGTRVPTRGAFWEGRFKASEKPLRKGSKQHCF